MSDSPIAIMSYDEALDALRRMGESEMPFEGLNVAAHGAVKNAAIKAVTYEHGFELCSGDCVNPDDIDSETTYGITDETAWDDALDAARRRNWPEAVLQLARAVPEFHGLHATHFPVR